MTVSIHNAFMESSIELPYFGGKNIPTKITVTLQRLFIKDLMKNSEEIIASSWKGYSKLLP